ncbi:ssrAB-activated protein [Kosakonia radicincitans]|uniref:SrfA family protein n=1 Tax=Kosakonia radicincitans TaxID=283686 RepID=UPI000903AABE|nr:SrfA family protein [Kosakonia radicincitans]APG18149.1 ssrAB-activated protein [Kosakonia radicincitans]QEM91575.1 ssrAB-activated protein [Kosakonia radicincitans]
MAKTLLRSGDLDDFQAVGGGGQAVFDSALQIREALRLRKQQALVDCLAIPQVNDEGDRVDWYSPIDGRSVSWKAADEEARSRAREHLENTLDSAYALSRKCLQSQKTAQQLFGSLLEKALQFPGENHVFLVDGKPVITFWGFVNLNESARENVLDCLREPEPEVPEITLLPEPEPEEEPAVEVTFSQADAPLLSTPPEIKLQPEPVEEPPVQAAPTPEPAPVAATPAKKRRRYGLWALPVAAAVAAAIATPLLLKQQEVPAPAPVIAKAEPVEIAPPAMQAAPIPALTAKLPLHQAEVSAPAETVAEKPAAKEPVVISAIPKGALVMDAVEVKIGSTKFLNGNWRVDLDVKDPVTGKAPVVRYQIQNNKGSARIVHGKNITCRADLFSGLHETGELLIKSRGNARCSDGTRYPMPDISCKAGSNDVAECSARFDAKTTVPVTFRKTGD